MCAKGRAHADNGGDPLGRKEAAEQGGGGRFHPSGPQRQLLEQSEVTTDRRNKRF